LASLTNSFPGSKRNKSIEDKACTELQEVMDRHTRSSPYLVQFYKQPLEAPCACRACRLPLWELAMLPAALVATLPHCWQAPLPIPMHVDQGEPFHYMPLSQARLEAFTAQHRPSALKTRAVFTDVFVTRSTLTCVDNVEPFFDISGPSKRQHLSNKLCCFCAMEDGLVDDELTSPFGTVRYHSVLIAPMREL
jgi:hypothetical protein